MIKMFETFKFYSDQSINLKNFKTPKTITLKSLAILSVFSILAT